MAYLTNLLVAQSIHLSYMCVVSFFYRYASCNPFLYGSRSPCLRETSVNGTLSGNLMLSYKWLLLPQSKLV
jgi:hypothetical protein